MTSIFRAHLIVALAAMPASCGAADAPAKPQQVAQVTAKPPVAEIAAPPTIGKFRLRRAPQQGSLSLGIAPQGTSRLVVNGQDVDVAPDGTFLVGFGRDHDATAIIVAYLADGRSVSERVPVAKRAWKIENLKTVQRYSQPDAEFQARRPGELAQINAARKMGVQSNGWRQRLIWPSKGRISGFFGSQRIYAGVPGAPHSGVDVAAGQGAPVIAPADGVVTLAAAAPFTLEGNLLIVDHGMGLDSAFLHLSRIVVKRGDVVRQGQLIGYVGATGRASGPHLHWGMKWKQERIDPQPLAGPMMMPAATPPR
jgi:murein DD-endopeptidase MepM/ murein hydrolase activator NlpD